MRPPPRSTLFPYTTLFRSCWPLGSVPGQARLAQGLAHARCWRPEGTCLLTKRGHTIYRSEEHTSELQSHVNLVCRLLLEKKKRQMQGRLKSAVDVTRRRPT